MPSIEQTDISLLSELRIAQFAHALASTISILGSLCLAVCKSGSGFLVRLCILALISYTLALVSSSLANRLRRLHLSR